MILTAREIVSRSYSRNGLSVGGIYRIKNKITGDSYVGQSTFILFRMRSHFGSLAKRKSNSIALQKNYDRYGIDAFEFEILEKTSDRKLWHAERKWMRRLRPSMNVYTPYYVRPPSPLKGKPNLFMKRYWRRRRAKAS